MLLEAMLLFIGLMMGVLCAALLAYKIFVKRERQARGLQSSVEAEKIALRDALNEARAHISGLEERARIFSEVKEEIQSKNQALEQVKTENAHLLAKLASLSAENHKSVEYFNQRLKDLSAVHDTMKETFSSISQDAMVKNADLINASFKQSIEHFFKASEQERHIATDNLANIMKPLKEVLLVMENKVQDLETKRQGAYVGLKEQIDALLASQAHLQKETHHLAQSLNAPTIRGRWGEMQLRRVVELSGLSAHCDFVEQKTVSDEYSTLRPDMIVTLPKNKKIVIDAKAPLELLGQEKTLADVTMSDEQRGQELAQSLRRHLLSLKKKSYYSVVGSSPEFVVMFLPGEAFLHWALLADPNLLDYAAQHEVIIATPITLVALLKAIAFGFKQESIANNIEDVRRLSQQLIDRINTVANHFEKLGKNLKNATDAYNQTLASLDSRVLVTARKLAEIKSLSSEAVTEVSPYIDSEPRELVGKCADEEGGSVRDEHA
jgi:DNA recombination protein RmuC